ncbi:ABC transporter ATP-binding protein [Leucobacter sp. CSA1]|uniref:ABC transporter ATP-binding protein n=1 Tax=Leucobacter chromiisoli TaxID=2796471 RepID=A0A934Q692_9MICO|nr:ABC transporter ATP-binding protein [Leucobacter chromiisoli]MBK0418436.1 ABC transporter ATP-binding protein [Leucobacter chromiisoli]
MTGGAAPITGRRPGGPVLELRAAGRVHGEGPRRVRALAAVDLAVASGEFVAVMGPSGSGKSTLLHLAGGLDAPSEGEVLVEGAPLASMRPSTLAALRRRSVGYVFQEFNLLPGLTAAENVAFPLELDGWGLRQAGAAARSVLAECGIADLADRRPEDMSGGQAQRVAIARALVGPRRLLLADEPTGALDSKTGSTILELLRDRADRGAAVVMVTHEARFAAWADRTVYLRDGRIAGSTGPSDPAALLGTVDAGAP